MADVQSNKRPKKTSRAAGSRDARIDALESEIHALRSEVALFRQQILGPLGPDELASEVVLLRSEVALHRQQLQRLGGHHDVLPVVTQTPTLESTQAWSHKSLPMSEHHASFSTWR